MELLGQTNLEEPDYACYCLVNAIRKQVFQWDMFGEEVFFLEQTLIPSADRRIRSHQ